jgi:biopolymer transport protein ExbD
MTLMALSMSKNEGMKVKVPAASSASAPDKKKATATVTVMANGEMFFNKEKVAAPQLSVKLNALKAESKECQVMVNGDGDASWTQMVKAVDEIKKLGITNVGLSVERK